MDGASGNGTEWCEKKEFASPMAGSEVHANWMVNPDRAANWVVYTENSPQNNAPDRFVYL
jgi:hypothetical protein